MSIDLFSRSQRVKVKNQFFIGMDSSKWLEGGKGLNLSSIS